MVDPSNGWNINIGLCIADSNQPGTTRSNRESGKLTSQRINKIEYLLHTMEKKKNEINPEHYIALGLALGVGIGSAVGVAMGNIAMGVSLGIAVGLAIGAGLKQKHEKEKESGTEE